MINIFAIFGDPVSHSRSPLMHNSVFKHLNYKATYTRVHLKDGKQLRETFFKLKLKGANVTVPHKESAFEACDEVRGFAKTIGVVNTLIEENGKLIGYNTDADGFLYAIRNFTNVKSILIIGAGGTAKALANKFNDEHFKVTILNRSKNRLDYFQEKGFKTFEWNTFITEPYDLIVNTTSAGLEDKNYPLPIETLEPLLKMSRYCADVIYGELTPFLKLAKKNDITYVNGTDMLLGQGVLANAYFTNETLQKEDIERVMVKSFSL
jgi:shikimate dehydrogenase